MKSPRQIFGFEAASNLKKHGVSFAEAMTVFDDALSSTLPDDQHSNDELRFITVGMSLRQRLLFVVYTDILSSIRIIGARLATATARNSMKKRELDPLALGRPWTSARAFAGSTMPACSRERMSFLSLQISLKLFQTPKPSMRRSAA